MLNKLTNVELLSKTKEIASQERKIQVELLWHLLEIQKRKLYLEIGFPSLYEYVVKELGYGHGAAYRRIQSMRLLESVPDVAEKIEEGSINLSTASQIQNFIKSEKKNGGNVSYKQRVDMLNAIENKSAREVEQHLIALKPENVIRPEKIRMVTPEIIEMRLMIPDELKDKMDKLRQIFSHRIPDMTYLALMEYLVTQALNKVERKERSALSQSKIHPSSQLGSQNISGDKNSLQTRDSKSSPPTPRNISSTLRHAVWLRDGGVCSYRDPATGRKCGGRHYIQVDHIHPWSKGGENKLENLQLLCAEHNRRKGAKSTLPPS